MTGRDAAPRCRCDLCEVELLAEWAAAYALTSEGSDLWVLDVGGRPVVMARADVIALARGDTRSRRPPPEEPPP